MNSFVGEKSNILQEIIYHTPLVTPASVLLITTNFVLVKARIFVHTVSLLSSLDFKSPSIQDQGPFSCRGPFWP